MTSGRGLLDGVALVILALELWIPLFWLSVHPFVDFWRRQPRARYIAWAVSIWLLTSAALVVPYDWWLAERFSEHPLLAAAGLGLIAADLLLLPEVNRALGWRVLVGLAEVAPEKNPTPVVATGIYARIRHPRYAGMLLAWWGAALVSGATRFVWLLLGFTLLALLAVGLEERELRARLGEGYARYCRRAGRFFPRLSAVGNEEGGSR